MTSIAAIQLIESGELGLDDLVEKWVPEVKELKVMESVSDSGVPVLRDVKQKPTVRHLITHTAGFSYPFSDKNTFIYMKENNVPAGIMGKKEGFQTPLIFEPGSAYEYGANIDWLGFVVEAVTGQDLWTVLRTKIIDPCGLPSTRPILTEADHANKAIIHARQPDSGLQPIPQFITNQKPDYYLGGHCLYSSFRSYSILLSVLLNDGVSPITGKRILQKKTIDQYLFAPQLPNGVEWRDIRSHDANLMAPYKIMDGVRKTWSLGLLVNLEDYPDGRRAYSGAWGGLPNVNYWVDRKSGIAVYVGTQVFPYLDKTWMEVQEEFERTVYKYLPDLQSKM